MCPFPGEQARGKSPGWGREGEEAVRALVGFKEGLGKALLTTDPTMYSKLPTKEQKMFRRSMLIDLNVMSSCKQVKAVNVLYE
jgi:hypothetical protein